MRYIAKPVDDPMFSGTLHISGFVSCAYTSAFPVQNVSYFTYSDNVDHRIHEYDIEMTTMLTRSLSLPPLRLFGLDTYMST